MITTLCYLIKDGQYLMLHRTKKENDMNKDKYLGLGGHFERGESPEECITREVYEESGFKMNDPKLRGIVTFLSPDYYEYMFLFTCDDFSGTMKSNCNEGDLEWIPINEVNNLPLWEGDKIFFKLLEERDDVFSLKLEYDQKGRLLNHTLF